MDRILIGRQTECEELQECLDSGRSEFVTVSGRRRIGKTYLIDVFFDNTYDFSFVGVHKVKTKTQLRNFKKALDRYARRKHDTFNDWYDAFDALEEYLSTLPADRKKVIFIDEMPWIDSGKADFVEALENFWNAWANRRYDIVLIASGSATSWLADNLFDNQGGLHNRVTHRLHLSPFTLRETEEYLGKRGFEWTRYDILQSYMLTGGVPYYLTMLKPKLSIAQNIDKLCFEPQSQLQSEFNELYPALFSHADKYIQVVQLLYNHKTGLSRSEISKAVKYNGNTLTTILRNLEQCDFIEQYGIYGKKNATVYRLVDFYTRFYLKFIYNYHEKDSQWWMHHINDSGVRAWQGLSFELVCMRHHNQIKRALGISGIATSLYTWKVGADDAKGTPGSQIDMLIERADRVVHLCEMKFSQKEYNITAEYENRLRDRMWLFDTKTANRKPLVHTFITTYGIGEGKHNSIVHSEMTMDDLFNN